MAPKGKAKMTPAQKKQRAKERRDNPDIRAHENEMQRLRTQMKASKAAVRKEFKGLYGPARKEFVKVWRETGNFNHAQCNKIERTDKETRDQWTSVWRNFDQLLTDFGWEPSIADTDYGKRAYARAEAVRDNCKKMKRTHVKVDPQTGDEIYRRLTETNADTQAKLKRIETSISKDKAIPAGAKTQVAAAKAEPMSETDLEGSEYSYSPSSEEEDPAGTASTQAGTASASTSGVDPVLSKALADSLHIWTLFDGLCVGENTWLKPWEAKIQETKANLVTIKENITKTIQGKCDKKDTAKAEQVNREIQQATHLWNSLAEVKATMENALGSSGLA
ncbi:unnamed protein product [Prorocentrum cordatum]|uniref:Uncharacterized protein n=1 Tax=Prorocentrum cordatum TaxID=2364126 RepID=A0ABN9WMW6_9DINO|nr:unnamed protein product [Polarella glacialis]